MSLNEYTQEIVRRALVEDVAILCDDPNNKVQITAALLQRNALRSAHTEVSSIIDIELTAMFLCLFVWSHVSDPEPLILCIGAV